jgi:hypothetical protein
VCNYLHTSLYRGQESTLNLGLKCFFFIDVLTFLTQKGSKIQKKKEKENIIVSADF